MDISDLNTAISRLSVAAGNTSAQTLAKVRAELKPLNDNVNSVYSAFSAKMEKLYADAGNSGGTPPPAGTLLANEGGTFDLYEAAIVSFGAGSSFIAKLMPAGKNGCGLGPWGLDGTSDPAPFTPKSCIMGDLSSSGTPPAPPPPAPAPFALIGLVTDGDESTTGIGNYNEPWPDKWATLTGKPVAKSGYASDSLSGRLTSFADETGNKYSTSVYKDLFILAGRNDITLGATDLDLRQILANYVATARNVGFRVSAGTLLPRAISAGWTLQMKNYADAYNTWLLANYQTLNLFRCVNTAAAVTLGSADYSNDEFLSNAGGVKIAAAVQAGLVV